MAESAKKPRHVSPATHSTARPVSRFLNAHTLEPRVRPRRSRVCSRAGAARAAFPPRAARRHRHPVTRVQWPHTPRGEARGEDCPALGDSKRVSLRALARGLAPSRGRWASVAREAPPGAAAVALSGSRVLAMGPTWRLLVFLSFLHVAWFDLPTFRRRVCGGDGERDWSSPIPSRLLAGSGACRPHNAGGNGELSSALREITGNWGCFCLADSPATPPGFGSSASRGY